MPRFFSKKTTAFISALDAAERRPSAARLCGVLALLLLAASFVPDLVLVMDFSRPYQIAQFSQDEFWFMEAILKLQDALATGDWAAIHNFGSPFAYGFPFWLFAALIALPFRGHTMLMALFLRVIFMAMKYAAFYVIYRRILALTQKPIVSLLSLILILAIPAFVFDGKIIGPEYFIMLLVAAAWSALFVPTRQAQIGAGFAFALAAAIKINILPLGLLFLPPLWGAAPKQRLALLKHWVIGVIVPVLLLLFPAQPFKEILAIGATHHVSYGPRYLSAWYGYNALEFDDMLIGGWRVDFINWFLFLALGGFAFHRFSHKETRPKSWPPLYLSLILGTFAVGVFVCFLLSLTSLLHPWFAFAPFLLLIAAGCLLLSMGRAGTAALLIFVLLYVFCFGDRYFVRWEHRIDKFDYIAATEQADADVAGWIAVNCPKARAAVIDYNLIWPGTYNGHLQKMWTLIQVEDYRREKGSATDLLNNIDLLLLKNDRVKALLPNHEVPVPAGILGNFFPLTEPYYIHQKDFPQLSLFARKGACEKEAK